nr:MAG TPA: hypothetical protein [Caudoviricetes sp.]
MQRPGVDTVSTGAYRQSHQPNQEGATHGRKPRRIGAGHPVRTPT